MRSREAYVLGAGMTRFGPTGPPVLDRAYDAAIAALEDAGIDFADVDQVFITNAMGVPTTGTRLIKDLGLTGVPVVRVEAASATGTAGFHEAVHAVWGGRSEVVLVLGFDDITTMGGANAFLSDLFPLTEAIINPAAFFAFWAVKRMEERGTTAETLARIAAKNWNNGRLNPYAERQADSPVTAEQVLGSRMVAFPHTSRMCCPTTMGAAAVVVGSPEARARHGVNGKAVRVAGGACASEKYETGHMFAGAITGPPEMARRSAFTCYEQAGIGPEDLDFVGVHDAYAIEELLFMEEIGLCEPGEADRLVNDGDTQIGGRIPVSTDGGFISRGHPPGATGLAQIWEQVQQLRGTAGARQVEGAKVGLAHIMGAGSVSYAHVLTSD